MWSAKVTDVDDQTQMLQTMFAIFFDFKNLLLGIALALRFKLGQSGVFAGDLLPVAGFLSLEPVHMLLQRYDCPFHLPEGLHGTTQRSAVLCALLVKPD